MIDVRHAAYPAPANAAMVRARTTQLKAAADAEPSDAAAIIVPVSVTFLLFPAAPVVEKFGAGCTANATPEAQIRVCQIVASTCPLDRFLKDVIRSSDGTFSTLHSNNEIAGASQTGESLGESNWNGYPENTHDPFGGRRDEQRLEAREPGDGRVTFPRKTNVVGTAISMTSYSEVIEKLDQRPTDRATVVAVCTVHSVMSARRSPLLAEALAAADINTSDGVPLVWAIRWTARPEQERVYGPELTRRAISQTVDKGWRHYFYGSTPETLAALEKAVLESDPDAQIVGSCSPPFRSLSQEETDEIIADIKAVGTDVVWVGLGMPKQELWMHEVQAELPGIALVGVGAAFDFIAGTKKEAPPWIQRSGLEWLFRLWEEPRRLWRRYIFNNPAFVVLLAKQIAFQRLSRGNNSKST